MAGSEAGGVVTSREPFKISGGGGGMQSTPAPPQPVVQNMRLAYSADGTAVYKPVGATSPPYQANSAAGGSGGEPSGALVLPHNLNISAGEPLKRKRGRPRKYVPDGPMGMALTAAQAQPVSATPPTAAFSPPQAAGASPTAAPHLKGEFASPPTFSQRKSRGRPPGSSKKQQQMQALGSAGVGFTPHVITVKAGEDVSSKIMSFSQHGPRAVCILSANGAISNVTLRQAATSGGTATYEGRFDILSLSGSFLLSEVGGQRSRTGGLSISLAGPDGRVLGGCVAGLLTAASPVQVIAGSFIADVRKEYKPLNQIEAFSAPSKFTPGATGTTSPPSRGTFSESSGGHGSPLNHSSGAVNNSNPQNMSDMPWK